VTNYYDSLEILRITVTLKHIIFPRAAYFLTINLLIGKTYLSSHICVRAWKRSILWQIYEWKTRI